MWSSVIYFFHRPARSYAAPSPRLVPEPRCCWGSLALLCAALVLDGAAAPVAVAPKPKAGDYSAAHAPPQPRPGEPVKITALLTNAASATLQYQVVEPGRYIEWKDAAYQTNWISLAMKPGKKSKAGTVFTAELPGAIQTHRRLVRYRFTSVDAGGTPALTPRTNDPSPNFAYFVYDGIPAWIGAINPTGADPKQRTPVTFGTNVMRSVQAYHLIAKSDSVEKVMWREQAGGKEYKYTGTLVADGVAYDHVRFRARGGVWRFAMGKNMWKFDFPAGHGLAARDDFGRAYDATWGKLNLRACIDQGDYGMRGNQGMFETIGFQLFNLAGVAAPNTHWVQLRVVDGAEENPADQYRGDFWGLYLAIENEDGNFLDEHGLPDGNIYKMNGGTGELSHHGANAVTNRSDLDKFLGTYNGSNPPDAWWRTNLHLPRYYSYRSIIECIHHYDVDQGAGKNYDYYRNPKTGLWQVIPWDVDLTFADHMFGGGDEPFRSRVLPRPVFQIEYQSRLREIRDLLYNPDQADQLIDEYAAFLANPAGGPTFAGADRAKWDFHPVMAIGGKAGQGRFYQAAPTKDFAGMVQLMKNYVKHRGAWIDAALLNDPKIPATPTVMSTSPAGFPAKRLSFRASPYQGAGGFAAIQWRLGEVAGRVPAGRPTVQRPYEITTIWESETPTFAADVTLPSSVAVPGHAYRVRVRMKDATDRWSHWSAPVEFEVGK